MADTPAETGKRKHGVFDVDGARVIALRGAIIDLYDNASRVKHYAALGGMLNTFSVVEKATYWLIANLARSDQTAIAAIVYPLRVDSAISIAKRIIKAKRLRGKAIEEILQTLEHLSHINKTRNTLLHLGADVNDDQISERFKVTNEMIAFHKGIISRLTLSNQDLIKIQHDLIVITSFWVLYDLSIKGKLAHYRNSIPYKMAQDVRKRVPLGARIPWLYKFRAPKGPANKSQKRRRKPTPPPLSSRG